MNLRRFIEKSAFAYLDIDTHKIFHSRDLGSQQSADSIFFVHESSCVGSMDLLANRVRYRVRYTVRRCQIFTVRMGGSEFQNIVRRVQSRNKSAESQPIYIVK